MKADRSTLFRLFLSTFSLSAFTFGGGYVMIPLMKKKFCDQLHWIEEQEILDLTAIAQSSPGPIAVNASILIGHRVGGLPGALVSILGTVLPPLIILTLISTVYTVFKDHFLIRGMLKGMQAGVAAVIVDVVWGMGVKIAKKRDAVSILLMVAAFVSTWFFGVNVALIILFCALFSAARALFFSGRRGNKDAA